ncbi:hypothetical protein [Bradyrhizobium sp. 27S5]|jgi:hypothetical protein|uniref:hypothetical protein n=2 Tax=unclassified Bradyrhizobium TaxID=2631580 RepID=UPI0030CF30B0
MRLREPNRNMLLLGTFTLLSMAAAGAVAVLDPASPPANAAVRPAPNQVPAPDLTPVRIVGTPFVPNTNPRQR